MATLMTPPDILLDEKVVKYKSPSQGTSVVAEGLCLCLLCSERLLEVTPDNAWRLGSIDSSPKSLALVVLDDWASLSVEGSQTFPKRIDVIIGPLD